VPYASTMSHGLGEEDGKDMAAIREPRASPSKDWWNDMAIRKTTKEVPVATDMAMPMNTEWKRIPASRRRHCRSWRFWSSMLGVWFS